MKCPNRQFDIHQVGSIESCSVCNHYNGTERTVADLTAELERVQKQSDRWRDEKHKADDLLYRANERAEKLVQQRDEFKAQLSDLQARVDRAVASLSDDHYREDHGPRQEKLRRGFDEALLAILQPTPSEGGEWRTINTK
jgi:predicted  nucleic acid-binding Zn-ribbon protein